MAVVNTRIVYRSHCLLGDPWGEDFAYDEAVLTGKGASGWLRAVAMSAGLGAFMLANSMAWSRRLLARWLPKPGEGPDAAARAAGHFCLWFYGRLPDGALLRCEVRGEGDPGYAATSRMLGEAGACLAQDALPAGGGFWTPASALAEPLPATACRDALCRAGCGRVSDSRLAAQPDTRQWLFAGRTGSKALSQACE